MNNTKTHFISITSSCLLFTLLNLFFLSATFCQKSVTGEWSPIYNADMVPVAATNLPDGKILAWSAWDRFDFEGTPTNQTYTSIFNPATNNFSTTLITNTGHDMFCPGVANIGNGEVVITGGSNSIKTTIYNPANNTFRAGQDMNVGRGYHGMCTLTDGRVFTVGGSWSGGLFNRKAEVWSPITGWVYLDNVTSNNTVRQGAPDPAGIYRDDNHAWLWAMPDGKVFQAGPGTNMHIIGTNGAGSVTNAGNRGNDSYAMNGNSVMYDIGKILTTGGAQAYSGDDYSASNRAYDIDISSGNNARVSRVGNMTTSRTLHNSVVLPNGEVVVVGGQCRPKLFTDDCARYNAEIWNPNTGQFSALASMQEGRTYHSVGLLMKDGRVWVGGGGLCGDCDSNHPNAEIFSPPYLFDGNNLATRPIIRNAPRTASYNTQIDVRTNRSVQDFVLMRLSSATHSVNNEQRRIPLTFSSNGNNNYTLAIPARDWLPPGEYYLFALNNGVPSQGETIRVGTNEAPTQLIPNGNYYVESLPTAQHLASPSFDGVNARMVNQGTGVEQQWEFNHIGENVYTLKNLRTNRFLNVDGVGCENLTNVTTWWDASPDNSRWIITKLGNEYTFQPVHCSTQALDNGDTPNGNAITWVFSSGNNNQRFKIKPVEEISNNDGGNDDNESNNDNDNESNNGNNRITVNGNYLIKNQMFGQHLISPVWANNDAMMYDGSVVYDDHKWKFTAIGAGKHTIQNIGNNRYLNADLNCANGVNVSTQTNANVDNAQWYIEKQGDNYFLIPVFCATRTLDQNGPGLSAVISISDIDNINQQWTLVPLDGSVAPPEPQVEQEPEVEPEPEADPEIAPEPEVEPEVEVAPESTNDFLTLNGTYVIKSSVINQNVVAPSWNNFDVRMFDADVIYNDHKWKFVHLGAGKHTIQNEDTNRYLGVANAACSNGANVLSEPTADSDNFRWFIEKRNNDYYLLPAHCTTQGLDKNNGYSGNALLWVYNQDNNNQKFDIIRVDDTAGSRSGTTLSDLRATPEFGQKTKLEWTYYLPKDKGQAVSYTFQHYDENTEDFTALYTVTTQQDNDLANKVHTEFIHDQPVIGNNYYQVKIEFLDGRVAYSNHRVVAFEAEPLPVNIAPNPAMEALSIDLSNYMGENIHYMVLNLNGQIMTQKRVDTNHQEMEILDLTTYQNGNYFLLIKPEGQREIAQKFVVMKNY